MQDCSPKLLPLPPVTFKCHVTLVKTQPPHLIFQVSLERQRRRGQKGGPKLKNLGIFLRQLSGLFLANRNCVETTTATEAKGTLAGILTPLWGGTASSFHLWVLSPFTLQACKSLHAFHMVYPSVEVLGHLWSMGSHHSPHLAFSLSCDTCCMRHTEFAVTGLLVIVR